MAEKLQGLASWLRYEASRHDSQAWRNDKHVQEHVATLHAWADEVDAAARSLASEGAAQAAAPAPPMFYAFKHNHGNGKFGWTFHTPEESATAYRDTCVEVIPLSATRNARQEPASPAASWVPFTQDGQLPEAGSQVLLWVIEMEIDDDDPDYAARPERGVVHMGECRDFGEAGLALIDYGDSYREYITHWMLLPNAPAPLGGKDDGRDGR